MLALIGDFLNWALVGILFPLLMLPMAVYITPSTHHNNPTYSTLIWLLLTVSVVFVGLLFLLNIPNPPINRFPTPFFWWIGGLIILSSAMVFSGGPINWMQKLQSPFEYITKTTGRLVMGLLFVMAIVQFTVVVLRHVFGLNYIAMQESITYMHGAVFLLAAGYALLTDDHVRVDLFYRDASEKHKARVNLWGTYLLLIPICSLIIWAGGSYVYASWFSQEGSNEQSGLQLLYLMKSFIPTFAILMMLAGFVIAARASLFLKQPISISQDKLLDETAVL